MRKGKYQTRRGGRNVKALSALMAVVLMLTCVIGGTLAWLSDKTGEVENTFTVGNIGIDLTEVEENFKMVPGATILKDPIVTVDAKSEKSWVFVEVKESANLNSFITYAVHSNWTPVSDTDKDGKSDNGVYYKVVDTNAAEQKFQVLSCLDNTHADTCDGCVKVNTTVTKEMMDAFDTNEDGALSESEQKALPTLTFQAYAIQYDYLSEDGTAVGNDAAKAWALAKANATPQG